MQTNDVHVGNGTPSGMQGNQEYRSLVEELGRNVVLAKVKVQRWRGLVRPKDVGKVLVSFDDVEMVEGEDTTTPSIRILPKEWEKRFSNIEGRLRSVINRPGRAVKIKTYEPFTAIDGSIQYVESEEDDDHVVTREAAQKIGDEIAEIVASQWEPAVSELVAAYPGLIAQLKVEKPEKYFLAQRFLPIDGDALRRHFRVRFRKRPLGLSIDDLTLEAVRSGAGEYLEAVRESIFRQAVEQLETSATYLSERLKTKGAIKESTLEATREAISFFKSFADVMHADNVMPLLREAEAVLASTSVREVNASTFKDASEVSGQLVGLMSQIVQSVDATELLDRSSRRQRKVAI